MRLVAETGQLCDCDENVGAMEERVALMERKTILNPASADKPSTDREPPKAKPSAHRETKGAVGEEID